MNSERQYKLLMNNVTKFTDGLSLAEVKRELIAAGILQTFHQKELDRFPIESDKIIRLLEMVSNRRGGYNAFHKALVKIGQEHLAEIMEPELDVVVDVMIKTPYDMKAYPKGQVLIFNNYTHSRFGTMIDARHLTTLFRAFGFEVIVLEDRTKQICGVDDKTIKVEDFAMMLRPEKCPALEGKPKMFFIQACRNYQANDDKEVSYYSKDMASINGARELDIDEFTEEQLLEMYDTIDKNNFMPTIPQEADIYIGYSTSPGKAATRELDGSGSWYMQAICEVFARDARRDDLLTLMTTVNSDVSKKRKLSQQSYTQTAEQTSRLTREFFFFSKKELQQ